MANIQLDDLGSAVHAEVHRRSTTQARQDSALLVNRREEASAGDFLAFIAVLQHHKIPTLSPRLLFDDTSESFPISAEHRGGLGTGGQYFVDRVYPNQRFPTSPGLRTESSIVYKWLLRADTPRAQIDERVLQKELLASMIREVRVLGNFQRHNHITQLLGVSWEVYDDVLRPVLALEYAQHNSLANFWQSNSLTLTHKERQKLCLEIASGLHALHESGLTWGDCKPENVLLFQDPDDLTAWTAKLNDFGGSVRRQEGDRGFVTFSKPWTAPEAETARGFHSLCVAEVFSYGMLVWAIQIDGRHYDLVLEVQRSTSDDHDNHDDDSNIEDDGERIVRSKPMLTQSRIRRASDEITRLKLQHRFKERAVTVYQEYLRSQGLASVLFDLARMERLLDNTLIERPDERWQNLLPVLEILGSPQLRTTFGNCAFTYKIDGTDQCLEASPGELDVVALVSEYGQSTELARVADTIFERLVEFAFSHKSAQAFFKCGLCALQGFGTDTDVDLALKYFKRSTELGHKPASGLFAIVSCFHSNFHQLSSAPGPGDAGGYGDDDLMIFDDLGISADASKQHTDETERIDYRGGLESQWLHESLVQGSPYTGELLKEINPEQYHEAVEQRKLGRSWTPYHVEAFESSDDGSILFEIIRRTGFDVLGTIQKSQIDVETRGPHGETLLLMAARCGQLEHVLLLLTNFKADIEVRDDYGVTVLHWLTSFTASDLDILATLLTPGHLESKSDFIISSTDQYGATLQRGRPLDWAVDSRHFAAVQTLLDLGADATARCSERPSPLHRAAARHDQKMVHLLLENCSMRARMLWDLDESGLSCLGYATQLNFSLDRILINRTTEPTLPMILPTLSDTQGGSMVVDDKGNTMLYNLVKWQSLRTLECTWPMISHNSRQDPMELLLKPVGPNKWSALRRALYATDKSIFPHLWNILPTKRQEAILQQRSSDGLTILHELAFVPVIHGLAHIEALADSDCLKKVINKRLPARGKRAELTPFQLAVLCQKFELASFLVSHGGNPLQGVDNARFLGYLLSYQLNSGHQTSSFAAAVLEDEVVNSLRSFPQPSTMQHCVAYVLQHEKTWWREAKLPKYWNIDRSRWTANGKWPFDIDARHDPMIAQRPGVGAWSSESRSMENAVKMLGYSGLLDANELGFGVRCIHARDYGSFLIKYRKDGTLEQTYGHKHITAIEMALDVAMAKPDSKEAEGVLSCVLNRFQGPEYCNYPYKIYLPLMGRTPIKHLRRRDTVLHRAVRTGRSSIVERILLAGADSEMANIEWQSPLRLATLLKWKKPFDLPHMRSTFLDRFFATSPVLVSAATDVGSQESHMIALLERAAHNAPWLPMSFWRALLEVRWPWDDYEADDMGLRFVIFYFIIGYLLLLLVRLVFFIAGGFVGFITALSEALGDLADNLVPFIECYKECKRNGTDPRLLCTSMQSGPARDLAYAMQTSLYIPAYHDVLFSMIDTFNQCYNISMPDPEPSGNSTEDFMHLLPGCNLEEMFESSAPWVEGNLTVLEQLEKEFVKSHVRCECSRSGKPSIKYSQ